MSVIAMFLWAIVKAPTKRIGIAVIYALGMAAGLGFL